jgi:hypothetical protein
MIVCDTPRLLSRGGWQQAVTGFAECGELSFVAKLITNPLLISDEKRSLESLAKWSLKPILDICSKESSSY